MGRSSKGQGKVGATNRTVPDAVSSELFDAVVSDDVVAVERALADEVPGGQLPTVGGMGLFHVAAAAGAMKVLRLLVAESVGDVAAELSAKDEENGWTPLHRAVYHGQVAACAVLVDAGAPVGVRDAEGLTALDLIETMEPPPCYPTKQLPRPSSVLLRAKLKFKGCAGAGGSDSDEGADADDLGYVADHGGQFAKLAHESTPGHSSAGAGTISSNGAVWSDLLNGVFTWGANKNFTLGHPDGGEKKRPTQVPFVSEPLEGRLWAPGPEIVAVATGQFHTMFLDRDGNLLLCGSSFGGEGGGRLGIPRSAGGGSHLAPIRVPGLPPVVAMAAGRDHSAAVASGGSLYVWGGNKCGLLGLGDDVKVAPTPTLLKLKNTILRGVAVSDCHTVVWGLERKGGENVWVWGLNGGQLGLPKDAGDPRVPRKIPHFDTSGASSRRLVVAAAAASPAATACLTAAGEIFVLSDYRVRKVPLPGTRFPETIGVFRNESLRGWSSVACSGSFHFCLATSGSVYFWSPQTPVPVPVRWECGRRAFGIIDLCVGRASAPKPDSNSAQAPVLLVLGVVAEDGRFYTASVSPGQLVRGDLVVPAPIPGLHQVHEVRCDAHGDHFVGLRAGRPAVDGLPSLDDCDQRRHEADFMARTESNNQDEMWSHGPDRVGFNTHESAPSTVVIGTQGVTTEVDATKLARKSSYFGIRLSPRWYGGSGHGSKYHRSSEPFLFPLPLGSPEEDRRTVISQYAKHIAGEEIELGVLELPLLIDLLVLAVTTCTAGLVTACEAEVTRRVDLSNLPVIFALSNGLGCDYLSQICAALAVNHLEQLLETNRLSMLPDEALHLMSLRMQRSFRQDRTFAINFRLWRSREVAAAAEAMLAKAERKSRSGQRQRQISSSGPNRCIPKGSERQVQRNTATSESGKEGPGFSALSDSPDHSGNRERQTIVCESADVSEEMPSSRTLFQQMVAPNVSAAVDDVVSVPASPHPSPQSQKKTRKQQKLSQKERRRRVVTQDLAALDPVMGSVAAVWDCQMCTFANPLVHHACKMCMSPRPKGLEKALRVGHTPAAWSPKAAPSPASVALTSSQPTPVLEESRVLGEGSRQHTQDATPDTDVRANKGSGSNQRSSTLSPTVPEFRPGATRSTSTSTKLPAHTAVVKGGSFRDLLESEGRKQREEQEMKQVLGVSSKARPPEPSPTHKSKAFPTPLRSLSKRPSQKERRRQAAEEAAASERARTAGTEQKAASACWLGTSGGGWGLPSPSSPITSAPQSLRVQMAIDELESQKARPKTSFLSIGEQQSREMAASARNLSKSIAAIQLEEEALVELRAMYKQVHNLAEGEENVDEETITIRLVSKELDSAATERLAASKARDGGITAFERARQQAHSNVRSIRSLKWQ